MTSKQSKELYYLHLIQIANLAINEISQVLLILAGKRLTLAEKAIISELHACAHWDGRLIALLSQWLKTNDYALSATDGKILRQTNNMLADKLKGFSKAASHSLNYLEQYFEHDLWLALNQDQISLRLSEIIIAIENKCLNDAFTKC